MVKEEVVSRKVSLRRTPLSFTVVLAPQRRVWTIIATPLAFIFTELRLATAAQKLPYVRSLIALGVMLGTFYVWWFCWNVFGRQELVFSEGDMTIASTLFGVGRKRTIRIADITAIRLREWGYRMPPCLLFSVRGRDVPYAFGESLDGADLQAVKNAIVREIPMLAGKMQS